MLLTALMTASLAAAAPLAQDRPASSQEGTVVVTGEKNKKDKRSCKRSVTTGSLMQKVTCRTGSEWEAEAVRNEIAKERMRGDQRWAEASRSEKDLLPP
jgi:hypothetical protein